MTSKVLDFATIGHALNALELGEWDGKNAFQVEFLNWYEVHRDEISKLSNLEALVSKDFAELNKFLVDRGFSEMFGPLKDLGVVSVLDMLVEWLTEGDVTTIGDYQAFRIYSDGVDIYNISRLEGPVVRLHTKTGHSLWLMKTCRPYDGIELNIQAQHIASHLKSPDTQYAGVIVPNIQINTQADMTWMTGMTADHYAVEKAIQQFKLRINAEGAHVEVATGMMVASASCGPIQQPYVFDEPFIGFFTQQGNDTLPIAAFWADTDSWIKEK